MKDIVIHVLDSTCAANNRDPEATALIEVAKTFGTVETLDNALAQERARAQSEINRLNTQHLAEVNELKARLAAIEERAVTDAELEILKVIRKKADAESIEFQAEIQRRDDQLQAVKVESENRAAQIKAILGF